MIIRYTIYILHYIKYLHGGCLSTGRWYRRHYTHTSLWRRVPFYTIHQELHAPLLTDYHRLIFMTATTWAMVDWRQPQIMWVVILVTVFIRRHLHWIILCFLLTLTDDIRQSLLIGISSSSQRQYLCMTTTILLGVIVDLPKLCCYLG